MRSIQEVGIEILSGTPQKFYCFVGTEYGIKQRYIDILASKYDNDVIEYDSVDAVLRLMSHKHIIPLSPAVYVVRYDTSYISTLDDKSKDQIARCNIIGTLVCIYEDDKSVSKLSKYLDNYTVSIDPVDAKYVEKYIVSDFPELPSNIAHDIASICRNYGKSKIISRCLSSVNARHLSDLDKSSIRRIFMLDGYSYDAKFQLAVSNRAFEYLCYVVDEYDKPYDTLIYDIMSALVEIDKLRSMRYSDSPMFKSAKQWTASDVYNMYDQCYHQLLKLRTTSIDPYCAVMYLISLLQFESIPETGGME